jgi:hypothetical protein
VRGAVEATRVAALAVVLLLALLVVAPSSATAERCPDCVRAGAGIVPLRVPPGTPLAGYGSWARRLAVPDVLGRHRHAFWFKPHEGQLDALAARALIVEATGRRLVWIAVDLVAVDAEFTAQVARRLVRTGLGGGVLIVSASHTHSGPGAFIASGILGAVSVDREDPDVRESLVESVVEAVRRADLGRTWARLGSARAPGPALTVGRVGAPVDQEVVVLKVVAASGAPIAVLWNYAIHGTMIGPRNLMLSGDIAGLASLELERRLGVPALYVNGAVGDVSPERHGRAEARTAAMTLAGAVAGLWDRIGPGAPPVLRIERRPVELSSPALSLHNCVGSWVPAAVAIPLGWALPVDTEVIAGALGDLAWVTIPGELQSTLGEAIKREARRWWPRALVAGVSNDYLGYFLEAEHHARRSYVACASLYGAGGGATLTEAAIDALRRMARGNR